MISNFLKILLVIKPAEFSSISECLPLPLAQNISSSPHCLLNSRPANNTHVSTRSFHCNVKLPTNLSLNVSPFPLSNLYSLIAWGKRSLLLIDSHLALERTLPVPSLLGCWKSLGNGKHTLPV